MLITLSMSELINKGGIGRDSLGVIVIMLITWSMSIAINQGGVGTDHVN